MGDKNSAADATALRSSIRKSSLKKNMEDDVYTEGSELEESFQNFGIQIRSHESSIVEKDSRQSNIYESIRKTFQQVQEIKSEVDVSSFKSSFFKRYHVRIII